MCNFIGSQNLPLLKSIESKVPMIILDSTITQLSWLLKWITRVFSTMMQTGESTTCSQFISINIQSLVRGKVWLKSKIIHTENVNPSLEGQGRLLTVLGWTLAPPGWRLLHLDSGKYWTLSRRSMATLLLSSQRTASLSVALWTSMISTESTTMKIISIKH